MRFDKLDAPTRATWDTARSRVVFVPTGVGGCDFLPLAPGGRYIACQAKGTDGELFNRSEIEPHQIGHLDAMVKTGERAFWALRFSTGGTSTAFLMPWQEVPWQTARTSLSVTPGDCAPWPLRNWLDLASLLAKL